MLKKNKNDIMLWCIIALLISSSFASFYYFTQYLIITRLFLLVLSLLISFFIFTKTTTGIFCWDYVNESFKEIYSISWPSNKETLQTGLIISAIVIIMAIALCLVDVVFFNLIKWVANFE